MTLLPLDRELLTDASGPADLPRPRSTVRELPAYVAGRRADCAAVAALASNESHFPPLPSVLEVVAHSAATLNRYPDNGALELRESIAGHLGVDPVEVAVGPGSTGVLQQIITAVCDAGDEVVFAWRSFEAYPILTRLAGAVPVMVPLDAQEGHDLAAMAAAITDRTRLVIVCTPNNPTGVSLGQAALESFLAEVPSRVLVVIDEAYIEYARPATEAAADPATDAAVADSVALYRAHPNVCVLRTFSKAYGLAGLRVGYAVAAPAIADGLRRTGMPFAVSAIAQRAAIASLEPVAATEIAARVGAVTAERERMIGELRLQGWVTPDSLANFVWLRMPDDRRELVVDLLARNDILVRAYAGAGVRISIADRASNDRVLAVLASVAPAL
ncbi:MAG: histidinol-phosphate transaminase [Herbiconiux sp.]|uniref:histidinol-phosphate transaminase n=1 Tax=Herbiconiux sp. TaxID=1871186 RepID=UPI00121993CD|nr:histidinol-phosphate transaminase [Herbiconiux sp.]TAJ48508.1 MAG: histidinol-phosphate transaminase [Herbiconiux sp.]